MVHPAEVLLHVRPKGKLVRCPCYRSRDVRHRGVSKQWLRTVPVGFKPFWLVVEAPRIGCASCGLVWKKSKQLHENEDIVHEADSFEKMRSHSRLLCYGIANARWSR